MKTKALISFAVTAKLILKSVLLYCLNFLIVCLYFEILKYLQYFDPMLKLNKIIYDLHFV